MKSSVTRAFSISPFARHQAICWPFFSVPWRTRSSASRPTYGEASRFVTSACSGWSGSYEGGGIVSRIVSKSGVEIVGEVVRVERRRCPSRAIA